MSRKTDIRYSEEANNYYRSVRKRFHEFEERLKDNAMSINYAELKRILEKKYNLYPEFKTLRSLFQYDDNWENSDRNIKSINMVLVMAVCDIFNLNVSQYTKLERTVTEDNQVTDQEYKNLLRCADNNFITNNNEAIEFIKNPHYFGEYYTYNFSLAQILSSSSAGQYQPQVNQIRESKLTIERPADYSDEVTATLEEITTESGNRFIFKGRVYRLLNINQIFISLSTTDNISFRWLMFDDIILRKNDLYFKEIAMLSHTYNSPAKPIFTKIILTKNRLDTQDPEIIQMLRGILTFNQDDILIDSNAVKAISESDEFSDIAEIFNPKYEEKFYRINQSSIMNNIHIKWDNEKKQRCILKLMELSMNPVQACVDQASSAHTFWKKIQNL